MATGDDDWRLITRACLTSLSFFTVPHVTWHWPAATACCSKDAYMESDGDDDWLLLLHPWADTRRRAWARIASSSSPLLLSDEDDDQADL